MSLLGTFLPGETQTVRHGNHGEGRRVQETSGFVSIWKTSEISAWKPNERIWGCLIHNNKDCPEPVITTPRSAGGGNGEGSSSSDPSQNTTHQHNRRQFFFFFSSKEQQKMKLLGKNHKSGAVFFLHSTSKE